MEGSNALIKSDEVRSLDILFSRGRTWRQHGGNLLYRRLIQEKSDLYQSKSLWYKKDEVANDIICCIEGKGGRFLYRTASNKMWMQCTVKSTRSRVKQALRDASRRKKKLQPQSLECSSMLDSSSNSDIPTHHITQKKGNHTNIGVETTRQGSQCRRSLEQFHLPACTRPGVVSVTTIDSTTALGRMPKATPTPALLQPTLDIAQGISTQPWRLGVPLHPFLLSHARLHHEISPTSSISQELFPAFQARADSHGTSSRLASFVPGLISSVPTEQLVECDFISTLSESEDLFSVAGSAYSDHESDTNESKSSSSSMEHGYLAASQGRSPLDVFDKIFDELS